MRLWHKDLIPFLPRQQLLGQWRECCLIAKNIATKGKPNHILVDRIMDYPINHFIYYGRLIDLEMTKIGYKINSDKFDNWFRDDNGAIPYPYPRYENLFCNWHNKKYLYQCLSNLQEKYDCGGITGDEWDRIVEILLIRRKQDA